MKPGLLFGPLIAACTLVPAAAGDLEPRAAPRLLLTSEDFTRIEQTVQLHSWAATIRTAILQAADRWPTDHNARYGLTEWELPPEGGQWTLWYVCPTHGVSLTFQGPGQNLCPVDGRNYTGWPFDQVIYARRHSEAAAAARDNGLAYRFTGDSAYAAAAARILLAYADVYASYPLKDTKNRLDAASGGRVTSQTLDEAVWLIPIAWAYDLIASSDALTEDERSRIELDLLRAAAAVIERNDARQSNWQSWHNAAIGAVGFALGDERLISKAIDGPSGFRYQMKASVLGDGVWYEGAWGYHFYALDAHCYLAEMAMRGGIDLYADPALRRMFETPLRFAAPDSTLPAFNDSRAVNLISYDRLYEIAYARYRDPLLATILGQRARGREALFWGAASIEGDTAPKLESEVFRDSGYAVLRAADSDHFVALKFGPHGGWHGHYDKLGFVSFARGGAMAVDPGTQSYAAPTHATWDKVTLAHNTVVVDERSQREAEGGLAAFAALPSLSAVTAEAGPAYPQVELTRTLILAPEYLLDAFAARAIDGLEHRYDWVYHNYGILDTKLSLEPYTELPTGEGYQHLSDARAVRTDEDWHVDFDMNETSNVAYGSTYTSPSSVRATFTYSREQAASGVWSGRMEYDFRAASGYILFQTPQLERPPDEAPLSLELDLYGDGSGHRLALRLYDSTDERFVASVGPIDWVGWRRIRVSEPTRWNHYLGNNDGRFDTPIKRVAVELTSVQGGPLEGALFVDDVDLSFAGAGVVRVTDYERTLRSLRLRMLAALDSTVVTARGLGPDLRKPVPLVLVRRHAADARFVALLEPYGEAPRLQGFAEPAPGTFEVRGDDFEDRIRFDSDGALRLVRRVAGEVRRLGLVGAERLAEEESVLLEIEQAASIQVDFDQSGRRLRIEVRGERRGTARILAPEATEVTLDGEQVDFERDGDYVVCVLR